MPQPPFETDVVQIEPGSGDTLTIGRDSADGSLSFRDAIATSGVPLKSLAGIRSVSSVYTVGVGLGCEYTTIQSALNAVPSSASSSAPVLILVYPGIYSESLTVEKDGVIMVGLGAVVSASSGTTVTIQESVSVTPQSLLFRGVTIENTGVGGECVRVEGGATSSVALERVRFEDCHLVASGVGGFQLVADTVNRVEVVGGSFQGSDNASAVTATNCAYLSLREVLDVVNVQVDYDNGNPTPLTVTSEYEIRDTTLSGNIQSTLTGVGSLTLHSVLGSPNLTVSGDQSATTTASELAAVVVNGTTALSLRSTSRTTAAGAGTLSEDLQTGSVGFAASASEAVTLTPAHPDANYFVHVETELTEAISVTSKTASGFDLSFSGPQTTTVHYTIVRKQ